MESKYNPVKKMPIGSLSIYFALEIVKGYSACLLLEAQELIKDDDDILEMQDYYNEQIKVYKSVVDGIEYMQTAPGFFGDADYVGKKNLEDIANMIEDSREKTDA